MGIVLFNAFFMPSNFQFDTLEISRVQFRQNKKTELDLGNEFKDIQGISIGSREYSQVNSWIRYGHGTYLYGYKAQSKDDLKELKHYGGYVGFLGEIHYKRYFSIGGIVGGGASYTEFTITNSKEDERSNYYLIGSPYITLGVPLTTTASINLTATTYILSGTRERIDGGGEGFEAPHNLENKIGLEFVWSWN